MHMYLHTHTCICVFACMYTCMPCKCPFTFREVIIERDRMFVREDASFCSLKCGFVERDSRRRCGLCHLLLRMQISKVSRRARTSPPLRASGSGKPAYERVSAAAAPRDVSHILSGK